MEQGGNFILPRNGRIVGITIVRLGIGTMKPTGIAPKVGLWETIGMTNKPPRVGDSVTIRGSPVIYVVTGINTEKNTADVKATRDVILLQKDVPWAKIFRLDESQNALRIVTGATDER